MVRADVATVKVGLFELQGLLGEDKEFYVGIPQIAEEFSFPIKHASRDAKALLGKDFPFPKLRTSLNSKPINALRLIDFELLLAKLDRKGNLRAQEIRDSMVGLSLHQLFCDAFNIKFEQEERQLWLVHRQETKASFHPLTDKLKEYGFKDGWEYARFVAAFQQAIGIENGTRDNLSMQQLIQLEQAQVKVASYMECGLKPWDALDKFNSNQ